MSGWLGGVDAQARAMAAAAMMPTGSIIDFAGVAAPAGYLACPAVPTNISRGQYPALFSAIGTTWGAGDGSTTFGMPYFPAGYVGIAGAPGVLSHGKVKDHTHPYTSAGAVVANNSAGTSAYPLAANTAVPNAPEGGPENMAAGLGILKCVKT